MLRSISAAFLGLAFCSVPALAAPCTNITFGSAFSSSYACDNLGTPTGVTGLLGGVAFLNANTLLIGGNANAASGYIAQIGVTRGANQQITGFSGPATTFASAPNIDGGLTFGPGGILFATGYPTNTLLQYLPGANAPSKIINLPSGLSSVGSLQFVPSGFGGAGQLKIASYNNGSFYSATLTPDGTGTFDVAATDTGIDLPGGPEGLLYVTGANAGFGVNSLLVSEYAAGSVGAYQVDANGNPIASSRQTFLSGLSGAEGAVFDPVTGDFLFSTFGSGNSLYVISGFEAPTPGVPEPSTWAMLILGFGLVGAAARRRQKAILA